MKTRRKTVKEVRSALRRWFVERRAALGLTQAEAARTIGVDQSRLCRIESGLVRTVDSVVFLRAQEVYGRFSLGK